MRFTEKGLENVWFVEAGVDGNGHDRKVCPWQGRVLTEASLRNLERLEENGQ